MFTNKEQIEGLILGQAIGDALGLGTEFLTKAQISSFYPTGLVSYNQIIQDAHRSRWKIGEWTDDTDQFLCILDSIQANQGFVSLEDIAKRLFDWSRNEGMGIGKLTYSVFKVPEYVKYPHKVAEFVWKMTQKKAAPNGALMRNGAIALTFFHDFEKALYWSEAICKLTHFDPRCVDSCKIHTTLLISLLKNEWLELTELLEKSQLSDSRTQLYIEQNFTPSIESFLLDDEQNLGYTFKTLLCVLWAYYHAESFEEGLYKIIHEGGDADTNASVAGTVLGAKFSVNSIPKHLVDGLLELSVLQSRIGSFNLAN